MPDLRSDPARLALALAAILLFGPFRPTVVQLVLLAAICIALLVAARRSIPTATLVLLLVGGLALRVSIFGVIGSDVLQVTEAAIDRVLAGLNPYGVDYDVSRPPGAPFPYGPLALAWYLPLADMPRAIELVSSCLIVIVLAVQGRFIGLAAYATAPVLVATASDGSNDTSLGLLLLLTFALARPHPRWATVVLAGAVAFKLSAAAWVPAFLLWAGWEVFAVFGLASLVAWSPVLAVWGTDSFMASIREAGSLHQNLRGALGSLLRDLVGADTTRFLDDLRYVFGGLVALLTLRMRTSLDGVIVAGALVYLATMLSGTWTTYAYFAAIGPVLCWRVDDWLGVARHPLLRVGSGAPAQVSSPG